VVVVFCLQVGVEFYPQEEVLSFQPEVQFLQEELLSCQQYQLPSLEILLLYPLPWCHLALSELLALEQDSD
jgi:hypothetical protein